MKLLKTVSCALLAAATLAGCGTSTNSTIGGTVTGLASNATVVLANNGTDQVTVTSNGNFTFGNPLSSNETYVVTVSTQPVNQTCSVTNGTGTISSGGGNVTNVSVSCIAGSTTNSVVTASVSGLSNGETLLLINNGVDQLNVVGNATTASGLTNTLAFPVLLSPGSNYDVTVGTQPGSQVCTVTNGVGQIPASGSAAPAIVTCQ